MLLTTSLQCDMEEIFGTQTTFNQCVTHVTIQKVDLKHILEGEGVLKIKLNETEERRVILDSLRQ